MKHILLYCCLITLPAVSSAQEMDYYLVLGSFNNVRSADIFADEMYSQSISPVEISIAKLANGTFYRVIHGPFDEKNESSLTRLVDLGFDQSWWLSRERPQNIETDVEKKTEILNMNNRDYALFCVRARGGERKKYCNDQLLTERANQL